MIQGWFGDDNELFFEINLIAADGLELTVDVLLDTGFSGCIFAGLFPKSNSEEF